MMAKACYDPHEAIKLCVSSWLQLWHKLTLNRWSRMQAAENVHVPQFISTHPSNVNRQAQLEGWYVSHYPVAY
jgi:hypothetical protein